MSVVLLIHGGADIGCGKYLLGLTRALHSPSMYIPISPSAICRIFYLTFESGIYCYLSYSNPKESKQSRVIGTDID
jgi:hypothetical protein